MLEEIHKKFIDNFLQTYSIEESARKAGIPNQEAMRAGIDMLNNPEIQEALQKRAVEFDNATKVYNLTKERFITILFNQYEKANKQGRTKEAVEILARIAEAQGVDLKTIKIDPVNIVINNLDENKI